MRTLPTPSKPLVCGECFWWVSLAFPCSLSPSSMSSLLSLLGLSPAHSQNQEPESEIRGTCACVCLRVCVLCKAWGITLVLPLNGSATVQGTHSVAHGLSLPIRSVARVSKSKSRTRS